MNEKISVIICAAGRGERAGFDKNKLLAPLYGQPVIYTTIKKFLIPEVDEIIVAVSPSDFDEISEIAKRAGCKVVLGGATRTESVKNALKEVTGDIVLIHDGARPFVTQKIIRGCIDSVKKYKSGICAIPCTDTTVCAEGSKIYSRPDRKSLYSLQTPQGFFTEEIRRAYALSGDKAYTDDSAVYDEFIAPSTICEGSADNIKLTYKSQFPAEYPAFSPNSADFRTGFGVDIHTFRGGDGITLCGVKIPCNKAFIAHSDGDVVIHAAMDALLSAAGLKDIGYFFPDSDPALSGISSLILLEKVIKLLENAGYSAINLSITIQAEAPRLAPYIDKMKENLSRVCKIPLENIGISAGTCEGAGFVGEGTGIAAYCAAFIAKNSV